MSEELLGSQRLRAGFVVCRSAEEWRACFNSSPARAIVTVGNFDGVHLGHQKILRAVRERAEALVAGGSQQQTKPIAAVLTFYPHPSRVLRPETAPPLLMTLDQRLAAFRREGMGAAFVLQFDRALAGLHPEEFVRRYLAETMHARAVLVGTNFRFGHKQSGDAAVLETLGRRFGFDTEPIAPVTIDGVVVSSTAIRNALREGQVEEAARFLGRPYALAGEIRKGSGLGTKLVVPTLNLATEQELFPKLGVYATEVMVDGTIYRAATNVGVRPTFDGTTTVVESHLLDFSAMLTSGALEVRFFRRLRDERKFSGPETLREQVLRDIDSAREYFGHWKK